MNKNLVLNFVIEVIVSFIVLTILYLIISRLGWTDPYIWDEIIGGTIGIIIFKLIELIVNKKKKDK